MLPKMTIDAVEIADIGEESGSFDTDVNRQVSKGQLIFYSDPE